MKESLGAKTLAYPTPVFVVCTYDKEQRPNAMTAAWGGICCSSPPCIAISLRKATCTYGNIMDQKAFTINIPSRGFVREADYFGLASGKDEDKFFHSRLKPGKSTLVNAPYVEEFPLVLECELRHTLELGSHTQFIGAIIDVKCEASALGEDGLPSLEALRPLLYAPGVQEYYDTGNCLGKAFSLGKEIKHRN